MVVVVCDGMTEGRTCLSAPSREGKVVALEFFESYGSSAGEGVVLVDDCRQTVVEEYATLYLRVCYRRTESQHEVELMVLELGDEFCHCGLGDVHLHMGIFAQEGCDGLGHDAGEGEGDTDVELTTHEMLEFIETQQAVVCRHQRLLGQWQKRVMNSSFAAIEKLSVSASFTKYFSCLSSIFFCSRLLFGCKYTHFCHICKAFGV